MPLDGMASPPINGWYDSLHQQEYRLLRLIQRTPGLMPISLAVHYSLLPKVITPLLSLICWLASFPLGVSLVTFVCAQDCVNSAIKWAVQRPRPRWYSPEAGEFLLVGRIGAWEVDLSFPSAHTQFFSGMAFCTAALLRRRWPLALGFGLLIGITRNYLSMHWPTDTLVGLLLGGLLGTFWGWYDPYAWLLQIGSPMVSLLFATKFTIGLLCLMLAARQAVRPVDTATRAVWFENALLSLDDDERESVINDPRRRLRARNLKSKVPMLVTVWCALAMTGFYPYILPDVMAHPVGGVRRRLLQTLIGLVGLAAIGNLKKLVGRRGEWSDHSKGGLKALTYVALSAWTFGVSQVAAKAILG